MATQTLITLDEAKRHLGIKAGDKSEDDFLNDNILEVSAAIAEWCNRTFDSPRVYTDTLQGTGTGWIAVRNRPILGKILTGTTLANSPIITGLSSTEHLFVNQSVSGDNLNAGCIIGSIDSATQITLTLPGTTATSTPNATASGACELTFGIAVWLDDQAAWGDSPSAFNTNSMLTEGGDYAVQWEKTPGTVCNSGLLYRLNAVWDKQYLRRTGLLSPYLGSYGNIKVVYRAGFETVPASVKLAAKTTIGRIRLGRGWGANVGGFSYRGFSPNFNSGSDGGFLTEDVRRLLAPYKTLAWGSA